MSLARGILVSLFIAGSLQACGGTSATAPVRDDGFTSKTYSRPSTASSVVQQSRFIHVVSKGETLYAVAFSHGLDFRSLGTWNGIQSPYVIYPGQQLTLLAPLKPPATTKPRVKPQPKTASVKQPPVRKQIPQKPSGWGWPAKGKLLKTFSASGRKGIDIGGKLGQSVYAAENGKVVYSGGGLKGYGQLIIIKHSDVYLSAYAHNQRLLVNEGDQVKQRQQIAEMGRAGNKVALLHFEIRRNGKPVDPMRYLPQSANN